MNSNGILRKHWTKVSLHFAVDVILVLAAFATAVFLRFGTEYTEPLSAHWPYALLSGLVVASACYAQGLYAFTATGFSWLKRIALVLASIGIALLVELAVSYLLLNEPLGRGAQFLSAALAFVLVAGHQAVLLREFRQRRERVAYVVASKEDELEMRLFENLSDTRLVLVGLIEAGGFKASNRSRVLGQADELGAVVHHHKIARVLASNTALKDPELCRKFCQLRYSGVAVMPLISLCEEIDQYVPLELVNAEWLLAASGEPDQVYIKKAKRLFDILVSLIFIVLSAPVLLLAMLAVKLTSKGPVFYRQTRSGRLGRTFQMTKLRSMYVNAEKSGAQWCCGENDPRVTPVGRFLRRYRIDELPQLFHVLAGDMSFVGPRPERPEMISRLAREIPFYRERTLIQPGITGWAQVSFPYGSSVEDAARKLEYDLYYMKHMSLFLDIFILLDTVRIVLAGGVARDQRSASMHGALAAWSKARQQPAAPEPPVPAQPAFSRAEPAA